MYRITKSPWLESTFPSADIAALFPITIKFSIGMLEVMEDEAKYNDARLELQESHAL